MVLAMTACQKNGYTINGTAQDFSDGDTLLLSTNFNEGIVDDTIVVSNQRFQLKGEADSAQLAVIFAKERPDLAATFLLEPGTITIDLAQQPGQSKVGGTKANEGWQAVTDLSNDYNQQMQKVAEELYGQGVTPQQQQAVMEKIGVLMAELSGKVIDIAEQHIDDELGYFLVVNYSDDDNFTDEHRLQLIDKLPQRFQQRAAVADIRKAIADAKKTDVGQTINDFSLSTPEGQSFSVISEARKHQLTILDFWASWCGPCRNEMPAMVKLYDAYHDKGLGIIGISLDEDNDAWVKAIADLGIKWPQISDLQGWNSEAAQLFHVTAIPFMVIIDSQGVILQKGLRGEALEQFVSQQLQSQE